MANAALFYLSRFAASEHSLRRVLENRLRRTALRNPDFAANTELQQSLQQVIEALIERHKKSGVLNDVAFAETKVRSMRRAGRSSRDIKMRLVKGSGVAAPIVDTVLGQDEDAGDAETAELQAALKLAKRRKMGAFAASPADFEQQRKNFATMARAGFGFDVIKKVLGGDIPEEDI